jgi:pSer/pThr/pTyr-binding forkhead associated (FHA) protein
MARPRPYLVFVSGPQAGQRVKLHSRPMEAGRLPSADIPLTEDYASRRQMRFVRRGDEWAVENLSANGTRINDRTYGEGKQVILGTGDVLGVGTQTNILYVGPGDDVEEAVAAYRREHAEQETEQAGEAPAPAPAAEEAPAAEAPAEEAEVPRTGRLPTGPPPQGPPPAVEAQADEAEQRTEEQARGAKRKKYLVFGLIYAVAFVALLLVLNALKGGDEDGTPSGLPRVLSEDDIIEAVETPLSRSANPARGAEMLRKAELYYRDRNLLEGNLYKAVKCLKLHLAYTGRSDFEELRHSRMYRAATMDLADKVIEQYEHAYRLERNGDWDAAERAFRELQRLYPAAGEPEPRSTDPVMNPDGPIWTNIIRHLSYISKQAG